MSFFNRLGSLFGLSKPAPHPGAILAATVTKAASLGFVPVAIHFDLFGILVRGGAASAEDVAKAANAARSPNKPELCIQLASDTLYIMSGLGLVDRVDEDRYNANMVTQHMVDMPSAQHGALHFTTEGLMGGAFLMKKLQDTNFAYPFEEKAGPMQYAYELMGDSSLSKSHTYSIMEAQGRMESFNEFMVGKFLKFGTFPERVQSLGYDLRAALSAPGSVAMVDIGGGRGELLLEVQAAFPHLSAENLVVQEFNAEIDHIPGIRLMEWNYQTSPAQPVTGARIYSLQHILHNLPDLAAVALLQKLSRAMAPTSRLLIIEYAKNMTYTNLHATMICLFGGRERSSSEWRQLAQVAGLKVTFEAYVAGAVTFRTICIESPLATFLCLTLQFILIMSIPRPREGDVNIGTATFDACWVLTAIVGVALGFRFVVKAWIGLTLPQVSRPERIWGIEDLLFLVAYGFDITHMTMIQMSAHWGLGRHFFYLSAEEKFHAMKWDFTSQPIAVSSAMVSRTGMMCFLLTCFAASDRRIRTSIIVCAVVQIVVNLITVLQIILQCGPSPYRSVDRTQYFHYMWTELPADGSVQCQSPMVQTTVGFVQGGFNTIIDFFLAALAAMELWQFFLRTLHRDPNISFWAQFRKINRTTRSRRIWQTLTLSGPLILSGAASIIKTYKLKSLGDRQDFTYNIVSFILWVKIENYSILLASCAPVARLFLRAFVDSRSGGRPGYWSRSKSKENSNDTEMKRRPKDQWMDSTTVTGWQDEESSPDWPRSESRISRALPDHVDPGCVSVKTEVVVQVGKSRPRSTSSGDVRLLPGGEYI
ncbi:hypothetical protein N7520_003343 [Penicillium odoratum]|uniref:uncharacterized protein n=1 Tax=Penicillium odoratum TaxID=1167516 RepID=UPI0025481064|nr:uncharacterized protein N7520_003343 [Penicillium odoratum]KAJ5768784.1 hypothetical protein N7520_003343 [Penicillium odoratum]